MSDDKTTARTKSGDPVRTTAPAGTPARGSPGDVSSPGGGTPAPARIPSDRPIGGRIPSDRPIQTLTPSRTVGGQTARLRVPGLDDDDASRGGEARVNELKSAGRTVGGNTMKLVPADDDPAAMIGGAGLRLRPRATPVAPAAVAPVEALPSAAPAPTQATPRPAPQPVSLPSLASPEPPTARAAPRPQAPEDDDDAPVITPSSIAVGLVFLAMGSMLTLTFGRRWVLPERPAAVEAAPPAAAATSTAAATAALSAAPAPPPNHTAAAPAATPEHTAAPEPPAVPAKATAAEPQSPLPAPPPARPKRKQPFMPN